jgi:hypothetical protein
VGAAAALSVAALAAVHLLAGRLGFIEAMPRSRWLSAAGGASVAYVFVHIFPELAAAQRVLAESGGWLQGVKHHAYLVALGGLAAFYGVERYMQSLRPAAGAGAYLSHIGAFAVYNLLVGYLVVERAGRGLGAMALFALAMALHLFVNDHGLRDHHPQRYEHTGRWILAAAVAAGRLDGATVDLAEPAVHLLVAFVAGGTVLNAIKEELPGERESRFAPFLLGAAGYSALLAAV